MNEPLEKVIQKHILDYLRMRGVFCWKNNNVGIYVQSRHTYIPSQSVGLSDITGVLPGGRFFAVEVKRPGGKVSDAQKAFIASVNGEGGLAFVAYSVDDVDKTLFPPKRTSLKPGVKVKLTTPLSPIEPKSGENEASE